MHDNGGCELHAGKLYATEMVDLITADSKCSAKCRTKYFKKRSGSLHANVVSSVSIGSPTESELMAGI